MNRKNHTGMLKSGIVVLLSLFCLILWGGQPVVAQSFGSLFTSAFPLSGIEKYIGPILPGKEVGSSFRSETALAVDLTQVRDARITGEAVGELDLRGVVPLDEAPYRYRAYANLRFWRLGARVEGAYFEDRHKHNGPAFFRFSGLRIGGDFDVVHLDWLSLGVGLDYFAYQPEWDGRVTLGRLSGQDQSFHLNLKGSRPMTLGPYFRYVPPEIFNFPLHVEARYNLPIAGSRYTTVQGALVFRPQIYRFDAAIKVSYERAYLSFSGPPDGSTLANPPFPPQNFDLNMEWDFLGLDGVVYF
ncbi:MAG: hypothetical protein AB1473_21315 [Thermodesulfobacteriota bacterium]